MKKRYSKIISAVALACAMGNTAYANTTADHDKEIIGYITNWDPWKSTNAGFPAAGVANHLNVDMSKFTILNYSFFGVAVDGSLHSGDHRNKNIYKESEVQQPKELLMSDIYSSWDYHLVFGELAPAHQLTDEAKAQGFTATGTTWTHEEYGLTGSFPIPVKKVGGKPGIIDHAHASGVKVMASIGGWSMCKHFPEMAADPIKRAKFMADVKRLMAIGFDGIDLDWEYPGPYSGMNFTGSDADYGNFLTLVKEIRTEIGADKLITAAFSADTRKLEGFDWPELDKYMDHYNMMTYDFNGGWSNLAGHNAPLHDYPGSEVPFFNWDTLADWMSDKGINNKKINMGLPFYGRGVVTETPSGVNATTIKRDITIQPDGPISSAADYDHWKNDVYNGTPNYFYVEQNKAGWEKQYDADAEVPYFTKTSNGKSYFLSYDDVDSIGKKAEYINNRNLGGAIVWTVVGDLECTGGVTKHSGKLATCANVNQPLANKINEVFASSDPTDPLVAFTSPSSGDVFAPGSDIPLQVNASDPDGTVTQVEFSANGISLGVDSTAPYIFLWQGVSAGDYSLVATVTDNSGKSVDSRRLTVSVNDDIVKPQVSYDGPSGDLNVDPLGPVQISATATYAGGSISSVDFVVNGQSLAGSSSGGSKYQVTYNPSDYGVHNVEVTATNNAGYSAMASGSFNLTACDGEPWDASKVYTNQKVTYEGKLYQSKWWNKNQKPGIDPVWKYLKDCGSTDPKPNKAPVVSNLSPDGGSFNIDTKVDLAVEATDSDGTVVKVDFYVNDAMVSSDNSAPYGAVFSSATAGNYSLKAIATDDDGASSEIRSSFTLTDKTDPNKAPVVSNLSPDGTSFSTDTKVELAVEATDSDGTVAKVDFYVNDAMVYSDTSAPYGAVFSSATPGSYSLKATATDDDGASSEIFSSFTLVDTTDPDPLSVTITNPANGIEFETGEVVSLSATATGPDAITSVDFSLDGSKLGSDTTAPYAYAWTAERAGTYNLVVKATDNMGKSASRSVTFSVKDGTGNDKCTADAWSASKVYNGGDRASTGGNVYQAKWWTQGQNPTAGQDEWYVWSIPVDCK
ncbi:MAG: hypothetical protein HRT35_10740 [Algicola sp.]|nr:hypothetical protein [Algicola sp.]